MVINPNDLFDDVKIMLRRNKDKSIYSITFPALDIISHTDHDLFDFSYDKIINWNKTYGSSLYERLCYLSSSGKAISIACSSSIMFSFLEEKTTEHMAQNGGYRCAFLSMISLS